MRRSSIFLLLGAVLLGLLAVLAARMMLTPADGPKAAEAPKTMAVIATRPLKFGDKVDATAVKTVVWPGALPGGAYETQEAAVGDGTRTALRDIKEGELLLAAGLTGDSGRLASSKLLAPDMRAVALGVSEVTGAGGFVAPGDRVDVIATRTYSDDNIIATTIIQGARVLAVGQLADTSAQEPVLVKSATIEVNAADAQKIAIAQAVGTISLALRATGDETRAPIAKDTALKLYGYQVAKQGGEAAPAGPAPASAPARSGPPPMRGPQVRIVRGTEESSYVVPG